jgi:hypothetical protein
MPHNPARRVQVARVAAAALVASALAAAQPPQKHFLWTVRAGGAPATYLVGSLHLLTPDYYPLSPVLERAFAASTVLIEEVDLDEMANPAAMLPLVGKAVFTDGRTLDQVIDAGLYKQVAARAEKAGIPAVAFQRMKPWMAAVSLTAPALKAAGFDPDLGIDRYFFNKAKNAGMHRRALETVAYQFDRLDQMTAAAQEALLRAVHADLDTQLSNVKTIADAWSRGEVAALETLLVGALSETPELYERLLVERNRNWVGPVESCVTGKIACFVVVGAAHLIGPHSLVALLQKKGYVVEQQ